MNSMKMVISSLLALVIFASANATIWSFNITLAGPQVVNPGPNFNPQIGNAVLSYNDVTQQMTLVSMSTTQVFSMVARWGNGAPGSDISTIVSFPPLIGPSLNALLGTWPVAQVLSGQTFLQYNPGNTSGLVDSAYCIRGQISSGVRLPVEMTSFSAVSGDNRVTLNWHTETESENAHFSLYRSLNRDSRGEVVGQVAGHGTTATQHNYTFVDSRVVNGTTYYYRISDVDVNGVERIHPMIVTAVPSQQQASAMPTGIELAQNYPNPFNPTTSISYNIPSSGHVTLNVTDVMGNNVMTLVNGFQTASTYQVKFDAAKLPSGTYFYTLKTGKAALTKKMMLTK